MTWIGLGLGMIFWFVDSLLDALVFGEGDITTQVLAPEGLEIWSRAVVLLLLTLLGAYAQYSITKQKRIEEALRESQDRYQDYYQHAPNSYLSVDTESGIILECNQAAAEMLGREKDEIIGRKVFEFYAPQSLEQAQACVQRLRADQVVHGVELQIQRIAAPSGETLASASRPNRR